MGITAFWYDTCIFHDLKVNFILILFEWVFIFLKKPEHKRVALIFFIQELFHKNVLDRFWQKIKNICMTSRSTCNTTLNNKQWVEGCKI